MQTMARELNFLLLQEPFFGKTRAIRYRSDICGAADYAVAIPVRNEEALLPRALAALRAAMLAADRPGVVVFAINDTSDASAAIIGDWLKGGEIVGAAIEVDFASEIRNAPHARRLAMDMAAQFVPAGALLTSDADSHVGANWVRRSLDAFAAGYDFVCEDVRLDEAELALLPDSVRQVGDAERAYFALSERLWHRWTGGMAGAFAYRASGASMAIRAPVYRAVGGLPVPASGEDAALCAAVLLGGGRVAMLDDLGTRTSARLQSRASGGCGEALAQRTREPDPLCDATLVPVCDLHRRACRWTADAPAFDVPALPLSARHDAADAPAPMRFSQILHELEIARSLLAREDGLDA